jgi:hypothetical protein
MARSVRAIDPVKYAAWSQGDVAHPNTKLPTIAADAQFEAVAQLVAAAHKALAGPLKTSLGQPL